MATIDISQLSGAKKNKSTGGGTIDISKLPSYQKKNKSYFAGLKERFLNQKPKEVKPEPINVKKMITVLRENGFDEKRINEEVSHALSLDRYEAPDPKSITGRAASAQTAFQNMVKSGASDIKEGAGRIKGALGNETFVAANNGQPARRVPTPEGERRGVVNRLQELGTGVTKALGGGGQIVGAGYSVPIGAVQPEIQKGVESAPRLVNRAVDSATSRLPQQYREGASALANQLINAGNRRLANRVKNTVEPLPDDVKEQGVDVVNSLDLIGLSSKPARLATRQALTDIAETGNRLRRTTGGAINRVKSSVRTPRLPIRGTKDLKAIQEAVAEPLTKAERRIAIAENRVTRGKDRFLRGKEPDTIAPSKTAKEASEVIKERIPSRARKTDVDLSKSIQEEVKSISDDLRPKLEKTPFEYSEKSKLIDKWDAIKKTQADTPEFLNFPGAPKFQERFENFLLEALDSKNLDELWKIRQKFDDFVASSIKTAGDQSAPFTQLQKEMWLENRKILNDMLKEASDGLGPEVKKAFSDMNKLYNARQNILSRADFDRLGKPGIIKKLTRLGIESLPYAGAGAVGGFLLKD